LAKEVQHRSRPGAVGAHLLGRAEREAAGEDGEPAEQALFVLVEQPVAPLQGRQQGLLPGHAVPTALAEESEGVVEPVGDLTRRQYAYAGRGQFQGQRHPVEPETDLCDGLRVLCGQPESGCSGGGPLDEQAHGREPAELGQGGQPARIGQAQRRHPERALAVTAQWLPAGRQQGDARTVGHDLRGQGGARVDQVLAVVQHQQHVPAVELCDQGLPCPVGRRQLHSGGSGDRLGDEVRLRQGGEIHERRAVAEALGPAGRHREGEPGLAAAAGSGEGQQSAPPERLLHLGDLALAADENGRGFRQRRPRPCGPLPVGLDRVGQQRPVEATCLRVGVRSGLPLERVAQPLVRREGLPAPAAVGQGPHQRPMAGLVQGFPGGQGPQHVEGLGRTVIALERFGQFQFQDRPSPPKRLGRLRDPGLVTVLGQ
jgi:hypothetical protein